MQETLSGGEDVAVAVVDGLAQEAADAWIEGFGLVEAPVLRVLEADGARTARALEGLWELVQLRAHLALGEQASVLVARGAELHAGLLVKAHARGVALRSTPMASAPEAPPPAPRASAPSPALASSAPAVETPALVTPYVPRPRPEELRDAAPAEPDLRDPARSEGSHTGKPSYTGGAVMPPKLQRKEEWIEESYPEEGDRVTHFTFGDCTVVGSDGERIRLQQDRDSRVREVALSMLKLTPPTTNADGVRHWVLGRKN